jgi:hypothetical protein
MTDRYVAMARCPTTGRLVSRSAEALRTRGTQPKPYGSFDCPACGESHCWYANVVIRNRSPETARADSGEA